MFLIYNLIIISTSDSAERHTGQKCPQYIVQKLGTSNQFVLNDIDGSFQYSLGEKFMISAGSPNNPGPVFEVVGKVVQEGECEPLIETLKSFLPF